MKNKTIYEFTVTRQVEVLTQDKKMEGDKEIVTTIKSKKDVPTRIVIKSPTRSQIDDGDMFYSVQVSQGVEKGLLTRDMFRVRINNTGGPLSKEEENQYVGEFSRLIELEIDLEKFRLKGEDLNEEDKKAYETLKQKYSETKRNLQLIEIQLSNLFVNTAEFKARNKTITWWLVNLCFYENEKGELVSVFGDGDLEKRFDRYYEIEDNEEEFFFQLTERLIIYITAWYAGMARKSEDFKKLDEEYKIA